MKGTSVLLQVGFARARVTAQLRELLPHDFNLTPEGRYVSVALSFELPRQDVILHLALVKPGLSSPCSAAIQRTPRHLS